ncbi:hypothetical protein HB364_12135 [Pseudoflavitalea sp. X16]|uniref:hypothetical protein n=1 Tax=Paraflavitalea devenefica TaxID=2716334 RepID=UPI001423EAC2|nr:hypothetical protein [Paraflavitalea devenefica]NII25838.1 hypothetical protein [Paraflavitalea devenefica]
MPDDYFIGRPMNDPQQEGKPGKTQCQEKAITTYHISEVQKQGIKNHKTQQHNLRRLTWFIEVEYGKQQEQFATLNKYILEGNEHKIRLCKYAKKT